MFRKEWRFESSSGHQRFSPPLILLHSLVILPYFYQPAEAARQFIRFPVTVPAFASSCRRFACDQRSSIRLFLARGYSGWPATENAIQGYTGEIAGGSGFLSTIWPRSDYPASCSRTAA